MFLPQKPIMCLCCVCLRDIQIHHPKKMMLPKEDMLNVSSFPKQQVEFIWNTHRCKNPKVCSCTNLWNMPYCPTTHIECILQLLYVRRAVKIKSLLIYSLQLFSCGMLYCSQYKSIGPWVSTILALLSIITLGWLSWCQEKQIEYLSRSIIELCIQSPPSTNAGDGLHED